MYNAAHQKSPVVYLGKPILCLINMVLLILEYWPSLKRQAVLWLSIILVNCA
jgi:hypothetical protein